MQQYMGMGEVKMITCNILYDKGDNIELVKYLREVLDKVYHEKFYFNTQTFIHKPMRIKRSK